MADNSILEAHMRRNPRGWRDLFKRYRAPTAMELAVAALEECRRDQLDHKQKAEYHTAMEAMLRQRDARLQKDIQRLSRKATDTSAAPTEAS